MRVYRGRLVVLALAVVLSLIVGWRAWQFWNGLPGVRLARLTWPDYERAQRTADARMSRAARQGLIAANVSHLFTSALLDPDVYPARRDTLQRMLAELTDTQIGRIQLAAFLMLEMERAAAPVEQWWPRLAPVLTGLERAQFRHFLAPLEDSRTEMYEALGLRTGAARAQAEQTIGQPHGPLLQYLAPRLGTLARTRSAAEDGSDVVCRSVLLRLLQQWVLDDGPPGMRLLAADLLAQAISDAGEEAQDPGKQSFALLPAPPAQIAAQLRQWRAAYRTAAAEHPLLPYPLRSGDVPELRPDSSGRFVTCLRLRMWMLGALCAAAMVGAVALILARRAFLTAPKRPNQLLVLGIAAAFGLGWLAWMTLGDASPADDVRRLAPSTPGLPRTPIIAFCLAALLLLSAALFRPHEGAPRRGRAARTAVLATWAMLFLSSCSLLFLDQTVGRIDFYPAGDRVTLLTGTSYAQLFDALQAWQP
ncbi:MAG: hypothetical protein GX547_04420 [Phycisphaerae bacterium]|nr:hypothetical protein [Phycisphaerae bacterium]